MVRMVQTCRYEECIFKGRESDLRICYRNDCNREKVRAQAKEECRAQAIANVQRAEESNNCDPLYPLTALQRNCIYVRCSSNLPTINQRICAMNQCQIQMTNADACFDAQNI